MIKFWSGIYTKEIILVSFKIFFYVGQKRFSLFALLKVLWIEQDIGKKIQQYYKVQQGTRSRWIAICNSRFLQQTFTSFVTFLFKFSQLIICTYKGKIHQSCSWISEYC